LTYHLWPIRRSYHQAFVASGLGTPVCLRRREYLFQGVLVSQHSCFEKHNQIKAPERTRGLKFAGPSTDRFGCPSPFFSRFCEISASYLGRGHSPHDRSVESRPRGHSLGRERCQQLISAASLSSGLALAAAGPYCRRMSEGARSRSGTRWAAAAAVSSRYLFARLVLHVDHRQPGASKQIKRLQLDRRQVGDPRCLVHHSDGIIGVARMDQLVAVPPISEL